MSLNKIDKINKIIDYIFILNMFCLSIILIYYGTYMPASVFGFIGFYEFYLRIP
jgi:hypothetical protein